MSLHLTCAAHYTDLLLRIREHHPNAISFINPPIFQEPPRISQAVSKGRVAISAHFYDALTMLGKRTLPDPSSLKSMVSLQKRPMQQ